MEVFSSFAEVAEVPLLSWLYNGVDLYGVLLQLLLRLLVFPWRELQLRRMLEHCVVSLILEAEAEVLIDSDCW